MKGGEESQLCDKTKLRWRGKGSEADDFPAIKQNKIECQSGTNIIKM